MQHSVILATEVTVMRSWDNCVVLDVLGWSISYLKSSLEYAATSSVAEQAYIIPVAWVGAVYGAETVSQEIGLHSIYIRL